MVKLYETYNRASVIAYNDRGRRARGVYLYLKRLEMQGFKSFVDKTILEFDRGITAIVGPNGSGKSNISDAVKWVLGEQSPKSLRGGKMEDVIFAGTENRRAVGVAEVSIIMDNSDGILHIDYEEVRVTRRLYRSGESEYLINGTACRLKDIHLLFADTGIGKDGYSIIGQGKVDEVLNSRSEDRRSIFEDASGIMKYRMRKQESERKLAAAEQNLLRIQDIVSELEYQVAPLEKQAGTAKQYLEYKYELRDIEVGVLADGIRRADEKAAELQEQMAILDQEAAEKEHIIENIKQENVDKTERSRLLQERLTAAAEREHELDKTIERLRAAITLNQERIAHTTEQSIRIAEEQKIRETQNAQLARQIQEAEEQIQSRRLLLSESAQNRQQTAYELEEAVRLMRQSGDSAEQIRETLMEQKVAYSQKKSSADALSGNIELILRRKAELAAELGRLRENAGISEAALKQAEASYAETVLSLKQAQGALGGADEEMLLQKKKIEEYTAVYNSCVGEYQSKSARLRLLREMEADFEGYAKSVKEVLTLCKENPAFGSGIHGAVAQIITVPAEYEIAVETALGAAYQNIVTESENEAKAAIDYLKQRRLGRATFLPISAVSGRKMEISAVRELSAMKGFAGIACELVAYDNRYDNIVTNLLGRVAVFETLDSAVAAARRFRYSFVCVTIEGDILRTSGAITGGSSDTGKRMGGALSRTREIPSLEQDLQTVRKRMEQAKQRQEQDRRRLTELEQTQASALETVRRLEVQAGTLSSRCAGLREQKAGGERRYAQLEEELAGQDAYIAQYREAIAEFEQAAAELETEMTRTQKALGSAEEQIRANERTRDYLNQRLMEQQLQEAELRNAVQQLTEQQQRHRAAIETNAERKTYVLAQIAENEQTSAALAAENAGYEVQIKAQEERKLGELAAYENLAAEKQEMEDALSGMMEKLTIINEQLAGIREQTGKLNIRRTKIESEMEMYKNRLWEEYELTYGSAYALTDGKPVENYAACTKRINELRTAIKQLGPINVNAIEELEETVKRRDFMAAQRDDMEEARDKLHKVIVEVTGVMRRQFMEQFAVIRSNFQNVFRELFGGGRADIVLAEGEDVLECGIEIQVQPPGKKLQNMLLLSGGERALTAIALLFGILRMRPSPFCLLDEIEAALDDANVYRLADYLRKNVGNMQFIMVTHRKGTMETADALYGVTMEEKGISRVLSLKIEKEQS